MADTLSCVKTIVCFRIHERGGKCRSMASQLQARSKDLGPVPREDGHEFPTPRDAAFLQEREAPLALGHALAIVPGREKCEVRESKPEETSNSGWLN
jgi:hypothetical protein